MLKINVENLEGLDNKEMAKEIRKELKFQFVGVKFSVTSDIYGIYARCSDEEFEINKEAIKDVAGMFAKYLKYSRDSIHINCRLASYCDTLEYKENQRKEYEKQQAEYAKQREEQEKLYNDNVKIESIDNKNIKVISVEDKEIFVTALEPSLNKNNWKIENDKYIDEKSYLNKYKITDIIVMQEAEYNYFSFNLLNDYDFLTEKGGTWSDDITGEVTHHCAVCVYCEGKEPIIVDSQGYSYARYTNRLVTDINNDLQNVIDTDLVINNESYIETINNIVETDLYIYSSDTWSYLDKKIINDERFIFSDYDSKVIITGLTYREMLRAGNGIPLKLEKLHYSIETLSLNVYKCETGAVRTLFVKSKLETTFLGIKFTGRLIKEMERVLKVPA
jgi:hypothetical protein